MKNSKDTIGNRTRDLPTRSAVYQPTALPRARMLLFCTELNYTGRVCDDRRSAYVVSSPNASLPEIPQYENSHRYYEGHLESKERSRIQPAQLFQCS
jgi:hypothetical protein